MGMDIVEEMAMIEETLFRVPSFMYAFEDMFVSLSDRVLPLDIGLRHGPTYIGVRTVRPSDSQHGSFLFRVNSDERFDILVKPCDITPAKGELILRNVKYSEYWNARAVNYSLARVRPNPDHNSIPPYMHLLSRRRHV